MKFVLLINLKLLTVAESFLVNISEHENFSANKYVVGIFMFINRENFMLSWVEHEKGFITLGLGIQFLYSILLSCQMSVSDSPSVVYEYL